MVNSQPTNADELFFIAILLLFLMINYELPLSNIYQTMVYLTIFMYITPIFANLFKWIPFSKKSNFIMESIIGITAGIGFIMFYNYLASTTSMAAVFAATAFGKSETIGKFLFGILIPIVESVFFFVIIPKWASWKMGHNFEADKFSFNNIFLIIVSAAIFTIFHATAKGLTNNLDLIATFAFGVLSLIMVIIFQSALPAVLTHIVVNSQSVGLFALFTGTALTSPYIIGAVVVVIFLFRKRLNIPFLT